jgi:threonine dehydrogenase-like Zn-dependent dehydrogenase
MMHAAILEAPGSFVVKELEIPAIKSDELLVKVSTCGICTSELDMWEGKAKGLEFPRFIGHEVSGVVEAVGKDVKSLKPGDRVALFAEGKGYAEYIAIREAYAVKLLPETRFDLALGEPIACSVNGVRKLSMQMNDTVCIVGCGFMGLIMLQVFKVCGAGMMIAVDTRDSILDLARRFGAAYTFNPIRDNIKKEVMELTEGRGVDIGVEAAGIQQTLDMTTELVRMEGKLEVFGFHQGAPRIVNWGFWNWMAFQIVNGHTRSAHIYVEGMRLGLALLESKKLDMAPLVTHHFKLNEINDGFGVASKKQDNFVKGVITLN